MSDGGARRGGELRTIAAWRQELSGGAARREALLGDCRAAMAEHARLNAIQSQINKDEALRAAAQARGYSFRRQRQHQYYGSANLRRHARAASQYSSEQRASSGALARRGWRAGGQGGDARAGFWHYLE